MATTTTGPDQDRTVSHGRRLSVCAALGVAVGVGSSLFDLEWEFALLVGWAATAIVFLGWVWWSVHGKTPAQTAAKATSEDDTRAEAGLALVAASTVSLIGVGVGLHAASSLEGRERLILTLLCILTIVLSWATVHTVFMLRYAHEYFSEAGGIDFGPEAPAFSDFAYFAFTIGMTYQVSDTPITSRTIRRTATHQALLSFVFGTTILAVTLNVVATFVSR